MAGGQAVNIFKLNRGGDPKEVLNWKLWFAVVSFSIMGVARGIDEGLISGTLDSKNFRDILNLPATGTVAYANVKANISAMVQIGSVAGAGLAFVLCDRIGRLWAVRELCFLWILGIVIFMCNNGNLGMVYAGRFIAGLGIGQTAVVAPIYLSEISPKSVRGLCTTIYAGASYVGIMLAYFSTWGASLHITSDKAKARWVSFEYEELANIKLVPTSLHIIFASIILFLSFFNYESPRYLIKCGKPELAYANLSRLRNLPVTDELVIREIQGIQAQLEEETEAVLGGRGFLGIVKEMFLIPSNRYRIYLGITSQLFVQWCGSQSLTVYAPDFFLLLGVSGQNEKLFATCIFGVVKLVGAVICAIFLVDVIGRKRSLMTGITIQSMSMAYIAIFLSICGTPDPDTSSKSVKSATTGAVAMIYITGFGYAMGWNSIQYLISSEMFPLRIRAVSSSLIMMIHFVNQYGANRAVPLMLLPPAKHGLGSAGSFWFWTVFTIVGGVWSWLTIPETAGQSLEEVDELFNLRWYQIGLYGAKAAELKKIEREREAGEKEASAVEVERV